MERRRRLDSSNRRRAENRGERGAENTYDTWRLRFDSIAGLSADEAITALKSEKRRLAQRKALVEAKGREPWGFLWAESRRQIDSVLDAELSRINREIDRLNKSLGELRRKGED